MYNRTSDRQKQSNRLLFEFQSDISMIISCSQLFSHVAETFDKSIKRLVDFIPFSFYRAMNVQLISATPILGGCKYILVNCN